ncbi:MAG TPA: hypothetical protein VMO47_13815 [Rhodothermales bacterium]|nr:hypothetical protein [Rhodothermales bacterium]
MLQFLRLQILLVLPLLLAACEVPLLIGVGGPRDLGPIRGPFTILRTNGMFGFVADGAKGASQCRNPLVDDASCLPFFADFLFATGALTAVGITGTQFGNADGEDDRSVLFVIHTEEGIREGNYIVGGPHEGPRGLFVANASWVAGEGPENVFNAGPTLGSGQIDIEEMFSWKLEVCRGLPSSVDWNLETTYFRGGLVFTAENVNGETRSASLRFNFSLPPIPEDCVARLLGLPG